MKYLKIGFILWSAVAGLSSAKAELVRSACEVLVQATDANLHPEIAPSDRKKKLIAERQALPLNAPSGKKITDYTDWGGVFVRTYPLNSGEKVYVNGVVEVKGQVLTIRKLSMASIKKKKWLFWHVEYMSYSDRAKASPAEMRSVLKQLEAEVQSYGVTLLVLEGERVTGARREVAAEEDTNSDGTGKAWVQITVDLNKKRSAEESTE